MSSTKSDLDSPVMRPSRTLVLCFDGTGNLYDATNTNVVKLFSFLKKDNKDEQHVYYQAGIGTYSAPGIMKGVQLWAAKLVDEAIAWYLDAHVMGGYEFLMQNYSSGDRICLFGFSRGAYTARALAGMLCKVGLLPKDNKEQVGFAYKMYTSTGKKNSRFASGFKQTFSRTVQIDFMGCWDTVSSVGVFWGRHLPFTSSNTIIKCFRHALSLDEHRVKFQPNTWHRDAPDRSGAAMDPEHSSNVTKRKDSDPEKGVPDQPGPATDVLEVWFAGCHGDIGGGETRYDVMHCLSNITLRWMLREIVRAQCGIQFDNAALERAGIPLSMLALQPASSLEKSLARAEALSNGDKSRRKSESSASEKPGLQVQTFITPAPLSPLSPDGGGESAKDDALDAVQKPHDELKRMPLWWVLEFIPLFMSWQDADGRWHREFKCNLGRGRTIQTKTAPNLHVTVQERIATTSLKYTPRAKWSTKPNATWVT